MTTRVLLLCVLLLGAGPAAAQGRSVTGQGGELYSIEKRDLMGSHELMVSLGTLPIDAFTKGLTLYGSYSYHFSHLIGWEIIGGLYSFNFSTDLAKELKEKYLVQATEVPELQFILNSNFVFKPFYGKLALTNDKLLTAEMFFVLGYAMARYTASFPPGLDAGVGIRMFVGKYFSLRLDIRDYLFLPLPKTENHLYVSLGLSLTFGFGEEQKEE
jgi:outer membrane beta-barrel protein